MDQRDPAPHDPTPHDPAPHDPAKARFFMLQAVRLSGVALGGLGALILGGILPLPELIGYLLLAFGAFDVFILPIILAKRWSSSE
ncbi:hypothetical protein [Erythrobacter sp. AP23]|uniref:hypothetical protein n=1 Tax=Erythrobacter sp. AP23 TaxID=499656 RepID=UPI00082F15EE|nr:hypothetical protein [Erythrobacter sp. AP23]